MASNSRLSIVVTWYSFVASIIFAGCAVRRTEAATTNSTMGIAGVWLMRKARLCQVAVATCPATVLGGDGTFPTTRILINRRPGVRIG